MRDEVERRRERQHVEVRRRRRAGPRRARRAGSPATRSARRASWRARERERVARRAVHLRDAAEAERILQVARGASLPEVAALEQPRSARALAARVRPLRATSDAAADVRRRTPRGRARPRRRARRAAASRPTNASAASAVEKALLLSSASPSFASSSSPSSRPCARSAFAGRSASPIEPSSRTRGSAPVVQRVDERSSEHEPHARRPAREPVREQQQLRPHDVAGAASPARRGARGSAAG